jgi:predicted  nucleic acid-binding Zn-ribbon protein
MSISPNVPTPQESYTYETNAGTPRWIAVLFGVLAVAVAGLAYAGHSAQTQIQTDLTKAQDQNKLLSAQLDQANSRLAELKGNIEVTQQKIGITAAELAKARSRAEAIRNEQLASDQKLATQLTAVQSESNEKIGAVSTDLGGAKKDIADTRTDLEATKGKLERANGDMGVMSGLIAHNHDDLDELKRRGDRNYYEFKISKSKTAQRVGPVQVTLNKTDQKKGKYTMTVFVDDRSIEKKDKTAGEPVQFYLKGATRMTPYEIVVFDVGKNDINGYLSTPKEGGGGGGSSAAPAAATPSAAPAAAPASSTPSAKPTLNPAPHQ